MKKHVLFVGFLFLSCTVLAQNKTLGVGVATPNSNAALHVESPTGNQGFILPRLTTAQRTATGFTSVLGAADNGLMVYDTNLNTIFIWNGTMWKTSAQVAGGPKLVFPYADTISSAPSNSNLFSLMANNPANQEAAIYATTNGSIGANVTNSAAILGETNTAFSAITGRVTAGFSNGVSGISSSPENGSYAVLGTNNGGGQAGVFNINNATNNQTAVQVTTNGTGGAGKFSVMNPNATFPALMAETNSNQPLSAPIYGLNTGTGDVAASFRINNTSSTFPALFAESNGAGRTATFRKLGTTGSSPAVFVSSQGGHGIWADHNGTTGNAAIIQSINVANPHAAMFVEAVGSGPSVWVQKSMTESTGDAIIAEHFGGNGRVAFFQHFSASTMAPVVEATTAGQGPAGIFTQTNPGVWSPALAGRTDGLGAAIAGTATAASTNANAAEFVVANATNPRNAVRAETIGTGATASFEVNNSSSTAPAVFAVTNGTGSGVSANNTSTGDAISAMKSGSSGSAGNFQITNGANGAAALFAMTNATNGSSIGAINSANGNALTIFTGGVRVSVETVSSTTIANRAAAYRITGGGTTFTFSFGTSDGEVFMVFNDSGAGITVEGVSINSGEGKTIIRFASGVYRGL